MAKNHSDYSPPNTRICLSHISKVMLRLMEIKVRLAHKKSIHSKNFNDCRSLRHLFRSNENHVNFPNLQLWKILSKLPLPNMICTLHLELDFDYAVNYFIRTICRAPHNNPHTIFGSESTKLHQLEPRR